MLQSIPDIANTPADLSGKLNRVGMSEIEVPVRMDIAGIGNVLSMASADAYVSLDNPHAKGIHMSRLFLALQTALADRPVTFSLLHETLDQFLQSHHDISKSAFLNLRVDMPMKRPALKSGKEGWRRYPVEYRVSHSPSGMLSHLHVEVVYSSTCPCSAALARQLIQNKFRADFDGKVQVDVERVIEWLGTEEGICATPHGQRSSAFVMVEPQAGQEVNPCELIQVVEDALKTPVQAVVKRADEQEFARLNGSNLMFAEDAARRVKSALESHPKVADFKVETVHYESLHPHNAVAVATKDK